MKRILRKISKIFIALIIMLGVFLSSCGCTSNSFIQLHNWSVSASLWNIIVVDYPEEDVICKFRSEKAILSPVSNNKEVGREIELLPNDWVSWSSRDENNKIVNEDYISIFLLKNSKVIGYGVLEISKKGDTTGDYQAQILVEKLLLIPITENKAEKEITGFINK